MQLGCVDMFSGSRLRLRKVSTFYHQNRDIEERFGVIMADCSKVQSYMIDSNRLDDWTTSLRLTAAGILIFANGGYVVIVPFDVNSL